MKSYFITDQGQVRSVNEDAGGVFFNASGQLITMVADGMGGHQAGEVASGLAVAYLESKWRSVKEIKTAQEAETFLQEALKEMNIEIYQKAKENNDLEGMGTTVVIAICLEDFVSIAHVGDSRAYLFDNNTLKQQTSDHSLVNELLRTGQISKGDAEEHPRKNVLLRAVGTEEHVAADIETIGWNEQDCLLLCSDGLTNKISDEELQTFFNDFDCLESLIKELTHVANERGGEDNITLAIIQHVESEAGDPLC